MEHHYLADALARLIVRIVVDLPATLFLVRFWVWLGACEMFDLPRPSWPQTWGLVIGILTLAH